MRFLFAIGLCVGVTLQVAGQSPDLISAQKFHEPGPLPDRIVLTWKKDPARTQAVTWRTDVSVRTASAQIAPAEAGPFFVAKAKTLLAVTTPFRSNLGEAHYHTVQFEDLTPRTKYAYRVGDGANWCEWCHFQTAGEKPEPFSFLYFGDAQFAIKDHWSRVVREAYASAPRARFMIHAGDLINVANSDAEWGEWHQAAGWINRSVPVLPTPGNHEYTGYFAGKLARHWKVQFALPDHGPPGLEQTVYYLDFQGVRIISLNSNEKREEQAVWLDSVLAENPNRWTILCFHHPILSPVAARANPDLRKLWQPVLDKYRVDLVLQGHDHSYGRSGMEDFPGTRGGTVYVVSVSGPGFNKIDHQNWMRRWGEEKQLYQVIRVEDGQLHYEARTAIGELYDSFTLHKETDGKSNVLVDGPSAPASQQIPVRPHKPGGDPWTSIPMLAILFLAAVLVGIRLMRRWSAR